MKYASSAPPFIRIMPWQQLFFFFLAGIIYQTDYKYGIALCVTLLMLTFPNCIQPKKGAVFFLCFVLGASYAWLRMPEPPAVPDWLENAMTVPAEATSIVSREPYIAIQGRVGVVAPLPGGRYRVVLWDVTPCDLPEPLTGAKLSSYPHSVLDGNGKKSVPKAEPYKGGVVWTLYFPRVIPVQGQEVALLARLAPVRSWANQNGLDYAQFWARQGVWVRASGTKSSVFKVLREAPYLGAARFDLLQRVRALLPHISASQADELSRGSRLLPALLFGDRAGMSVEDTELIAKATLSHSLALSGLHLGYMVFIGVLVANALGRLMPRLLLMVPKPYLVFYCAIPLACFYLWLGDAPVSLQRAFLMLLFWSLLMLLRRPKLFWDGLLAALAVLCLSNPQAIFDVSLQLSALSILAIALSLPHINALVTLLVPLPANMNSLPTVRIWWRSFLRNALSLLGMSLCIQVFLLPLTMRYFGTAALWFPLNLLWLPILGTFVMPCAFIGLFSTLVGLDSVASFFFMLAECPCAWLLHLLTWMDGHHMLAAPLTIRPHPLSIAGFWALLFVLPLLVKGGWKRAKSYRQNQTKTWSFYLAGLALREKKALLVAFLALLLCITPMVYATAAYPLSGITIRVFDVGAAQAVAVQWRLPGSKGTVLIDGGGLSRSGFSAGKNIVGTALAEGCFPSVDAIFVSHGDVDHLGGLLALLDGVPPLFGYYGNGDSPVPDLAAKERAILQARKLEKRSLMAGDRVYIGPELSLAVLWPQPHQEGARVQSARNSRSLVLRLDWQGVPLALLCGDIGRTEANILARQSEESLRAAVLLLPHHGSKGSYAPLFLAAVDPVLALASDSFYASLQQAHNPVYTWLHQHGIPYHTTGFDGELIVHFAAPGREFQSWVTRQAKK